MLQTRAKLITDERRGLYWAMKGMCANEGGAVIPMFNDYVFAVSDKVVTPETENMGTNFDLDGNRWAERWSMA